MGLSCAEEILSVSSACHLSTMHERDRQTDKQTHDGTVTSIATGEITCQRYRKCKAPVQKIQNIIYVAKTK